jgi:serine/threonine-protein kinase
MTGVIGHLNRILAGRYALEREIGAGGMATVYLARDLRHERHVALKVLKPELGAVLGSERFLAEIKVTANLQHPNLLPLFDSGEAEGLLFYVMPFVDGESLRARLDREKQLPVDEAVRIAVAVASALDYAHSHGVIHRDLKPENILLQAGQPVIADFGIALAVTKAGGTRITQTGLSLGTPQYMSPEQATGDRGTDGRTDIYSLGAMTYEMLTGEPPHSGSTAQAIIAKLMTEEVRPLTVLRRTVPPHVDYAVRHALEKLPADRFATAREFADTLQQKAGIARLGDATHAAKWGGWRLRLRDPVVVLLSLVVLVETLLVGWASTRNRQSEAPATSRFLLTLPGGLRMLESGQGGTLAISPDGKLVAFVSLGTGFSGSQMFIRPIGQLAATRLEGTETARNLCFSPDGKWIAFTVGSTIKKVSVDGGPSTTLATLNGKGILLGLGWGVTSHIIVGTAAGLHEVAASGGSVRLAVETRRASGEGGQRWPLPLGDGKTVFFMSATATGNAAGKISVATLENGKVGTVKDLSVAGAQPIGVLRGQLVYLTAAGALMSVPLDASKHDAVGDPFPMVEGVIVDNIGNAMAALSRTGTLIYVSGTSQSLPVLVDAEGTITSVINEPRGYSTPRYSPNGELVAFTLAGPQGNDVWIYSRTGTTFTRLTTDGKSVRPEWSPDGKRVTFLSLNAGMNEVWWAPTDGSGPPALLYKPEEVVNEAFLSPDGAWLVYRTGPGAQHPQNIFAVPMRGEKKVTSIAAGPFRYLMPRLSPDGRWIAYQADESGGYQIYVRPFPGPGGVVQVSVDGGTGPLWSRSGRTLYYRRENDVVAVSVNPGGALSIGDRRIALTGEFLSDVSHQNYDVAPDGTKLLMLQRAGEETRAVIVLNWDRELDAKRAAQAAR